MKAFALFIAVGCLGWIVVTPGVARSANPEVLPRPLDVVSSQPQGKVTVHADDSLEWQRDQGRYIAKGNARAVQDDITVYADTLIAYYESDRSENTPGQIKRLEAMGNVRLVTPQYRAFGGKASYDPASGRFILRETPLSFEAPDNDLVVRATTMIEYSKKESTGKAIGNAVAKSGDKTLAADTLKAYFTLKPGGKQSLERIEAGGNVIMTTDKGQMSGRKGVYDIAGNTANIYDDVVMILDGNTFYGQRGIVDLNTGVGRLVGKRTRAGDFVQNKDDRGRDDQKRDDRGKGRVRVIIPLDSPSDLPPHPPLDLRGDTPIP